MWFYLSCLQKVILEDEISLAPSVITIYAMGDFPVYTNTAHIMEDKNDLPNLRQGSVSLPANMADNLPCYKTKNDHDSLREKDSLITMRSHDNRFSSLTMQQGQTNNGVETMPSPSHQQQTILDRSVSIPIYSTSSGVLSSDDGYTSHTILSSSNDGYISSNVSKYRQCHVSLSPSASQYQPAPVTTMPCMTPSLSEVSFETVLLEGQEEETNGEGKTLSALCGDGYIRTDLAAVTMPHNNLDSGYKQFDVLLSPEVSECQPSLGANCLGSSLSLDEFEADLEGNIEEGTPCTSTRFTKDKHMLLPSRDQKKDCLVSLDSSGYLKDESCVPHSCGEGMDAVHLFFGDGSRGRQVSLDSSGYLKDNLTPHSSCESHSHDEDQAYTVHLLLGKQSQGSRVSLDSSGYLRDNLTVPPSFVPHSIEEDLDTVHLPHAEESRHCQTSLDSSGYLKDNLTSPPPRAPCSGEEDLDMVQSSTSTLDAAGAEPNLQTSVDLVTPCEFSSVCHLDLVQSMQDNSGYIHATMQSRRDSDGYIRASMQSRQDGDGYIHTDMQPGQDGDDYIYATMQPGPDYSDDYTHSTMHSRQVGHSCVPVTLKSGQDGDGYIDSGLDYLPTAAESASNLSPCYDSDVSEEYRFLEAENGDHEIARHLTMPDSEREVESNLVFGDKYGYIKCDMLNAPPVQSSTLQPMCSNSLPEFSDSSGYVRSTDFSSSTDNGMPRPLCPTTDGYIYT